MYSFSLQPLDNSLPLIDRSMSCNATTELIPVLTQICRATCNMVNPVALHMGDNVYRIFDINNPSAYVKVSIIKDAN